MFFCEKLQFSYVYIQINTCTWAFAFICLYSNAILVVCGCFYFYFLMWKKKSWWWLFEPVLPVIILPLWSPSTAGSIFLSIELSLGALLLGKQKSKVFTTLNVSPFQVHYRILLLVSTLTQEKSASYLTSEIS